MKRRVEKRELGQEYDHALPARLRLALIVSFFFFTGGQLVKGHFLRAFAFWAGAAMLFGLFIAAAEVTALVIEAIQNTVSAVIGAPSGRLRRPKAPS